MVVVPSNITVASEVNVPVEATIKLFPALSVRVRSAPALAVKNPLTVTFPPMLNGLLLAVNDPVVAETVKAPEAVKPLLDVRDPPTVTVPTALKDAFAVSDPIGTALPTVSAPFALKMAFVIRLPPMVSVLFAVNGIEEVRLIF
jgi:hypothetical protein